MHVRFKIVGLLLGILLLQQPGFSQGQEMQQLILNIEKLAQLKLILADMKKGYEILSTGYNTVKNISEGNFSLHKLFLDGLLKVSPAVKKYQKVARILEYQIILVQECRSGKRVFGNADAFNPFDGHIDLVYDHLIGQSLDCLNDLLKVLTDGAYRMSDQERLQEIDRIYESMKEKLSFLQSFNRSNGILTIQQHKERRDIETLRKYHQKE